LGLKIPIRWKWGEEERGCSVLSLSAWRRRLGKILRLDQMGKRAFFCLPKDSISIEGHHSLDGKAFGFWKLSEMEKKGSKRKKKRDQ